MNVHAYAAPSPVVADTWERSPETALSDDSKRRYRDFFRHRERAYGELSEEERAILAIVELGPSTPLDELAVEAGLVERRTLDSARKRFRELWKRLEARGLGKQRHVRLPFAACTHTKLPGTKGRLDCQRQRKAAGITTGCVAHHGHDVRELVPLTPRERARRLDLPLADVLRTVRAKDEAARKRRKEAGKAANDAEARRWRGDPVARGPKGTNHTSPRRTQAVPPFPSETHLEMETSGSQEGSGGRAAAPTAPRTVSSAEATQPTTATAVRPNESESTEGGRAHVMPAPRPVVQISEARQTRAKVDWFRQEWARRKLPPLNVLEVRQVLWCRARQLGRDELELGLSCAERAARASRERVFARVFADHGKLSRLLHAERQRRDELAPQGFTPTPAVASVLPRHPVTTYEDYVRERDRQLAMLEASGEEGDS